MTRNSISQIGMLFAPPYLHPSVKGQVTSRKHATWTTLATDPKAAADKTDGARCHTQPSCSPSRFEMTRIEHLVAPGRACPANDLCPDSGFTRDNLDSLRSLCSLRLFQTSASHLDSLRSLRSFQNSSSHTDSLRSLRSLRCFQTSARHLDSLRSLRSLGGPALRLYGVRVVSADNTNDRTCLYKHC